MVLFRRAVEVILWGEKGKKNIISSVMMKMIES
jgi:hypothetical protein